MFFTDSQAEIVRLCLSALEKEKYKAKKVDINKQISQIYSCARRKAKKEACELCNENCGSFCNSHSIPRFVLERIAKNGMLSMTLQGEIPTIDSEIGLNKTGVFHLICPNCDNITFKEYENPQSYNHLPTQKILAQIALKNYLQMVSKRNIEYELYGILADRFPGNEDLFMEKRKISQIDLYEYHKGMRLAIKALSDNIGKNYHVAYFRVLDYVVPFATQTSLSLISDFNDSVINNIYNTDINYFIKNIHVSVFPLENSSVILLFIENGEKRYRNFYRQLNKLDELDQLAAINYIVFSYTENVFINPDVYDKVKKDEKFMDVCKKSTDITAEAPFIFENPLDKVVQEFSLTKRNEIPNLLSKEYSII